MPAHYAHYRFGAQLYSALPQEVRRPVQRFRQLFDVGLHGPDLFFYYNILLKTPTGELGGKFHSQTGVDFFSAACRRYRLDPSEGALAYLYGVLAHYCLDSVCHPYVNGLAAEGSIGHVELETEFDRFLLTLDGKIPAHTYDCSRHMKLTRGECDTVAAFYPPATDVNIRQCVTNMAALVKWLASPNGPKRRLLDTAISLTGDKFSQHVMGSRPNRKCEGKNEELLVLYGQAVERYPILAAQLAAHLSHNAPLGEEFMATFG